MIFSYENTLVRRLIYFLLNLKTAKPLKPTDIDESKGKEKLFLRKNVFYKMSLKKAGDRLISLIILTFVHVHEELKTINAVYRQVQTTFCTLIK